MVPIFCLPSYSLVCDRYMHFICCSHVQCHLQVVSELVESARNNDYTDVVMIHEHRGEPDGIVVCHLPYGPSAYFGIFNTVSYCMPLIVPEQGYLQ